MHVETLLVALSLLQGPLPSRPVHTYSIVARDAVTGELGVAVQSHWFSVGAVVPWAEAGVGAVATQSFVEASYGPLGLELMRAGKTAPQALRALIEVDEHAPLRQVAMVDSEGRAAAHTGERCIAEAGHQLGEGYSVQANIMADAGVWPAMAKAFEGSSGRLAERLLAALEAAQGQGGDLRGSQSAALVVVRAASTGRPWQDRLVDLRVEDSPRPLVELRRLLARHRAYEHMNAGDEAEARGDHEGALKSYSAAARLAPDEPELVYWHAIALVNMGQPEEAIRLGRALFADDPRWAELTRRLVPAGLIGKEAADRLIEAARGPSAD